MPAICEIAYLKNSATELKMGLKSVSLQLCWLTLQRAIIRASTYAMVKNLLMQMQKA